MQPFRHFLDSISTYGDDSHCVRIGGVYLSREAVGEFLINDCGLEDYFTPTARLKPEIQYKKEEQQTREHLAEMEEQKEKESQGKIVDDRKGLLNIIFALKQTLIDKGVYQHQAEIISYLSEEYGRFGLSESNLKKKFAEANSEREHL